MRIGIAGPLAVAPLEPYLGSLEGGKSALGLGIAMTPLVGTIMELQRREIETVAYSLDPRVAEPLYLRGPRLEVYVLPMRRRARSRSLDFFSRERQWLREAIEAGRPDIVHAHWTYEYGLAVSDSRVPYIVTAHDAPYSVLRHFRNPYRLLRLAIAQRLALKKPRMTYVSPYLQQHFTRYLPPSEKGVVIPNGIALDADNRMHRVNSDFPKSDRFSFATVLQGWIALKNAKRAIEAFHLVRQKYHHASLLMYGKGYGINEEAYQWASIRGMADGIEFIGSVSNSDLMIDLQRRADVLLHPALEEACPMAIVEAMVLGIPIIGGVNCGGVEWTMGEGGLPANVRKSSELVVAMTRLIEDHELRNELGVKARNRAITTFGIGQMVDAYLARYAHVLSS